MSEAHELPPQSILDGLQAIWRVALATGGVPLEKEIFVRESLSDQLLERFERDSRLQDLYDAIHHIETIIRRLPTESPHIPQYSLLLSYLKVSEYEATRSARVLDEAVQCATSAREEASRPDVLQVDPDSYIKSLNALGTAQAHRYADSNQPRDLDDAIACGQELIRLAPKSSTIYNRTLVNLASRLQMRYKACGRDTDHDSAVLLINEQLETFAPGSGISRALTFIQLAELSCNKFEKSGNIDDLNLAITHGQACLTEMSERYEKRANVLRKMCVMHAKRYDRTGDLSDSKSAVLFSKLAFHCSPPSHAITGTRLWQHLLYVRYAVNATTKLFDVEDAIVESSNLMEAMSGDYPRRTACHWLFGDLLSRRYSLSGNLEDLITMVKHTQKVRNDHNTQAAKDGKEEVTVEKVHDLHSNLLKVAEAPNDNQVKIMACGKLQDYFQSASEANVFANIAVVMQNEHGKKIAAYAQAVKADRTIDEAHIEEMVKKIELDDYATEKSIQERRNNTLWKPEEYHTELGQRVLASGPGWDGIIFDLPGIVREIFDYEDHKPLRLDKFIQREVKLEQEARVKEIKDGKKPNTQLCRICRRIEILNPSVHGDIWNEKVWFVPFGKYYQLLCRRMCSICYLILCVICNRKDMMLHPRLAAIDPEVQGTQLQGKRLLSGENILRIKYGLKDVGALTILNGKTYKNALRQGFEVANGVPPEALFNDSHNIVEAGSQRISPFQLKKWLNNCDHNHSRQCNGPLRNMPSSSKGPRYHIDVINECLVRAISGVKYFALSYVWGKVAMSPTLQSNYEDRLKTGSLRYGHASALPKTIQDAMLLVRGLDERYLWVDALCIVQDDDKNLQQDIEQMDAVYSQAFATIVAMHGSDADAGLPGLRPGTRPPQAIQKIRFSGDSTGTEQNAQIQADRYIPVVATSMSLSLALDISRWNSRAWTFQEQLLSRRCLYFSEQSVYFQCNSEMLNEIKTSDLSQEHETSILNNPLNLVSTLDGVKGNSMIRQYFLVYKGLIEKYTVREMSVPSDILNAVAGLFNVFGDRLPGTILFGLPIAVFDLALLWTPARQLQRRQAKVHGFKASVTALHMEESPCPTWSWCGFVGPVEYHLFMHNEPGPLPTALIETYRICSQDLVYSARIGTLTASQVASCSEESSEPTKGSREDFKAVDLSLEDLEMDIKLTLGPNILQFQAFTLPLRSFKLGSRQEYLSLQDHIHTSSQQAVLRLYDQDGIHCGLCFDFPTTILAPQQAEALMYIAISRHEARFQPYRGPNRIEGEIPLFDNAVYPSGGPGSGLVNMILVLSNEAGIMERLTVARVHVRAWEAARPERRSIYLG